jgi:hypothetical protein
LLWLYTIYGLRLQSNRPIPGLEACPAVLPPEVRLWLGELPPGCADRAEWLAPWYVSPRKDEHGRPLLTVWELDGAFFRLVYSDDTVFVVDRPGTRIWATWPDTATLADTLTYLLGPILGFVLRRRGIACLHASAVAVGQRALALVGGAGAGKSTTAVALGRRGHAVLSEDVVPVVETATAFQVQPGYSYIRLWPPSVQFLFGSPDALPKLAPPWEKRYLDLGEKGCPFQRQPLPLAAVYVLGARTQEPAAPFVAALPAKEALLTLIGNTYANYLLDPSQRAREFESLGRLVASVPVRRVTPHADPGRLDRLCEVILDDFHTLAVSSIR